MNKNIIIGAIVGVLIIGGVSFYGGMKYAGAKTPTRSGFAAMGQGSQFRTGQNGGNRAGQGFGGVAAGQILSKDNTSITVKLSDGGSRIVFLNASTTITKSSAGSISDLTINENVIVNGSANSDGSINAQNIQIGSIGRFMMGGNQMPRAGGN